MTEKAFSVPDDQAGNPASNHPINDRVSLSRKTPDLSLPSPDTLGSKISGEVAPRLPFVLLGDSEYDKLYKDDEKETRKRRVIRMRDISEGEGDPTVLFKKFVAEASGGDGTVFPFTLWEVTGRLIAVEGENPKGNAMHPVITIETIPLGMVTDMAKEALAAAEELAETSNNLDGEYADLIIATFEKEHEQLLVGEAQKAKVGEELDTVLEAILQAEDNRVAAEQAKEVAYRKNLREAMDTEREAREPETWVAKGKMSDDQLVAAKAIALGAFDDTLIVQYEEARGSAVPKASFVPQIQSFSMVRVTVYQDPTVPGGIRVDRVPLKNMSANMIDQVLKQGDELAEKREEAIPESQASPAPEPLIDHLGQSPDGATVEAEQ